MLKFYSPIDRRRHELSKDNIKFSIDKLFTNALLLLTDKGWKYLGCEWINEIPTNNNKKQAKREELKNNVYDILNIRIVNQDEELQIPLYIPSLIHNHYFYLTGQLKVPTYQLYDMPIIYRDDCKDIIRFRNNILSMNLVIKKKGLYFELMKRFIPADLFIRFIRRKSEVLDFYNRLQSEQTEDRDTSVLVFLNSLLEQWDNYGDSRQVLNNLIEIIFKGYNNISNDDKVRRLSNILFFLTASVEIDYFTKYFMKEEYPEFELLRAKFEGPRDDCDLKNKRIRLLEYILLPLIVRLHEIVVALKRYNSNRFKLQPNIILDRCITSSENLKDSVGNVVKYNNIVNPIGEISGLLQCTLAGPGAFLKENVPVHLRNLHDSHFGILCPADTPDREGCGVIYNMVPTCKIDELGRLYPSDDPTQCTSYPISLVPFLEYDDPTRLQMASNQIKQSLPINGSEPPTIKTGNETLFLEEGFFYRKAKKPCLIIHSSPSYMCVLYDTDKEKKPEVYQIGYKSLYLGGLDYIETNATVGDRFKEGDTLYYSKNFIKNDELAYGRNFLTVIMPYFGYNYEDAIVISESASKSMVSSHEVDLSYIIDSNYVLLSLKDKEYVPIYKIGTELKKGETYARLKNLSWEKELNSLNEDPIELKTKSDCKIIQLRIFPNSYNKTVREYHNFIENLKSEQMFSYSLILTNLQEYLTEKEVNDILEIYNLDILDCKNKQGSYYYEKQKINGTLINIKGIYEEEAKIGDKLANRHGNKGVIALILPDDKMPLLPDGRRAEIIINPLGIVSRMNVGQLYELQLNEVLYHLKNKLLKNENKAIDLLTKFLNTLYTLESNIKYRKIILDKFNKDIKKYDFQYAVKNLCLYAPCFCSPKYENIVKVMNMLKVSEKQFLKITDLDGKVITTEQPVTVGYMYFMKLVHRSADKLFARSIGPYNKKTLQPAAGKRNQGGHRLGEMEVWSLLAHDANVFLKDLLTIHSDSVGLKLKELAKMLRNPSLAEISDEQELRTKTSILLESYLKSIGIALEKDNK